MRFFKIIFVLFTIHYSLLTISGCGYSVFSTMPGNLRTVYVEQFKNKIDITSETSESNRYKIYKPNLEIDITKAASDAFIFDGNLRIAPQNKADLILTGELHSYVRTPTRYTPNNDIEEYRVDIIVSVTLKQVKDNKDMYTRERIVGESSFYLIGPQKRDESVAINEAIQDLARRIVERTVQNW